MMTRPVLPKGVSQQTVFDVTQNIIQATPTLTHLSGDVTLDSFCPEGFVGFIHYHLLRFCQTTLLQYINSHVLLGNRCVLQHQHVDCKIADTLLKKGTKQHTDGWDTSGKSWSHIHVVCLVLVFSLRNVRTCGYLRMTSRIHPPGHPPPLSSSVTSMTVF
jgi:hypothetical protein